MKLASYQDGSRDGQLLVVSRDLGTAHYATGIATRLQQVLDDWNFLSPQLEALSQDLNHGKARHAFAFDPGRCAAPLPRACRWVVEAGAAGVVGTGPNSTAADGPTMEQHPGDAFFGPHDLVPWPGSGDSSQGLVAQARLAVVSGDLAPGTGPAAALDGVRLLVLASSLYLCGSAEGSSLAAHLSAAFAPLAVTPEELGPAWQHGRVHLELAVHHNGRPSSSFATSSAPHGHFGELLASLARHRGVHAGSIVGGRAVGDSTELKPGDTLKLDIESGDGQSLFGAIDLAVASDAAPA
jgi:fumarylacetoacetate (FAA) hydrolase